MLEQQVLNFVHANAILLLVGWYVFAAAVSNLPKPAAQDGRFYFWAYGFLHTLAGNIAQVGEAINARNVQNLMRLSALPEATAK